jgi:hypothetical protein
MQFSVARVLVALAAITPHFPAVRATAKMSSESCAASTFISRHPALKILSVEQSEGVGARVRRSIGRPELRSFDPFLMLVQESLECLCLFGMACPLLVHRPCLEESSGGV